MHTKTFKQSIIISVFETTGLILYNFKKVLAPLCKKLENRVSNSALISTPSSTSSYTTTRSWPTPQNISDFREYVFNMHDILNSFCRRRFDRFATASLGRMIAGVEAEKTLREHKKKAQEHAKHQSDSRKIVAQGGVMIAGKAAGRIMDRRMEEMEKARWQMHFGRDNKRARMAYKCKLEFLAELDNPHRSAPRAER